MYLRIQVKSIETDTSSNLQFVALARRAGRVGGDDKVGAVLVLDDDAGHLDQAAVEHELARLGARLLQGAHGEGAQVEEGAGVHQEAGALVEALPLELDGDQVL